jgi:hypothetical protein
MWLDRLSAEQRDAAARQALHIASSGGDAFRRLAELLLEQDEAEEFHDLRQAANKDVVLHLANSLLARCGARVNRRSCVKPQSPVMKMPSSGCLLDVKTLHPRRIKG